MTAFETLDWRVADGICRLTFNRPEKRNALDTAMRREFAVALQQAKDDPEVRVLLLSGAGGNFSAGGDLAALRAAAAAGPLAIRERLADTHAWMLGLINFPKPVVAAVDGAAFGGGLMFALAADCVIATDRARFCCVFTRTGLVPDLGGFWLLPRVLGLHRAKDIALTGRSFGSEEARRMGFVRDIVAPAALEARAIEAAHELLEGRGEAKARLNHAFDRPWAGALA